MYPCSTMVSVYKLFLTFVFWISRTVMADFQSPIPETYHDYTIVIVDVESPVNMTYHNPVPKRPPVVPATVLTELGFAYVEISKPASDSNVTSNIQRRKRARRGTTASGFWNQNRQRTAVGVAPPKLSSDDVEKLGIDLRIQPLALMDAPDSGVVSEADVDTEPYNAYGKLYFTDGMGREFECTGAYVDEYVVLTAAHCVFDLETRQFHSNFLFSQKYHDGPGVSRAVKKTLLFKGWYNKQAPGFGFDYAFLSMKDPSVAGYLTLATSDNYADWYCAGYPSNYKRGSRLQTLHGYKGRLSNTVVETAVNPMGQGCSGGAWFVKNDQGGYLAVGLNSFSVEGKNSMFSPRFKEGAQQKLFQEAKRLAGRSKRSRG